METVTKVNQYLNKIGLKPLMPYDQNPDVYWTAIVRGSVEVLLFKNIKSSDPDLTLSARLVKLPEENIVGLYRFLLEQNDIYMGDFCFSVDKDIVKAVEKINFVPALNENEFLLKLDHFSKLCDRFDDELSSRFKTVHIGYEMGLG